LCVFVLVSAWNSTQVGEWLQKHDLAEFVQLFADNHISGKELATLESEDLREMGVTSIGHRKKIIAALSGACSLVMYFSSVLNSFHRVPWRLLFFAEFRTANTRIKRIAIEGNIAAGKSTFLNILAREIDFHVVPEPVSRWTNMTADSDEGSGPSSSQKNGGNLLDMFYSEPNRYAYTFQTYAFLSRMRAQMRPPTFFSRYSMGPSKQGLAEDAGGPESSPVGAKRAAPESESDDSAKKAKATVSSNVQFFERSVYSDRYCFALNCYDSGLFSDVEWACYTDWHTWLLTSFPQLELDGFIYLKVDPKVCMKRLEKRNRSEEGSVKLDYLQSVHDRHEEWLIEHQPADAVAVVRYFHLLCFICLKPSRLPDFDSSAEHSRHPDAGHQRRRGVRDLAGASVSDAQGDPRIYRQALKALATSWRLRCICFSFSLFLSFFSLIVQQV
jgi:deoxycitidine kinase